MSLIFHFKCTLKCRLQFVSIWTSHLVMGLRENNTSLAITSMEISNLTEFKLATAEKNRKKPIGNIVRKGQNVEY